MDASFFRDINRFAINTRWAHPFMTACAVYGVGLFAVLVLAAWWYARYRPDAPRAVAASVWAAAGTVIAVGVNQLIVSAVHRPRPFVAMPGVEVLVSRSHDFSFPSDHTITAGAATAGLWIIAHYGGKAARRLAITGTVLALFLAFARVYVGAHYPGDVVAGLVIGAPITTIGWFAVNRALTYLARRIAQQTPLRPLIAAPPQPRHRPAAA